MQGTQSDEGSSHQRRALSGHSRRPPFGIPQALQTQCPHFEDIRALKLRIEEIPVVAGHKQVVTMLAVQCRQVGQEIQRVGLRPANLAGEEREGVHTDPHSSSPWEPVRSPSPGGPG